MEIHVEIFKQWKILLEKHISCLLYEQVTWTYKFKNHHVFDDNRNRWGGNGLIRRWKTQIFVILVHLKVNTFLTALDFVGFFPPFDFVRPCSPVRISALRATAIITSMFPITAMVSISSVIIIFLHQWYLYFYFDAFLLLYSFDKYPGFEILNSHFFDFIILIVSFKSLTWCESLQSENLQL